MISVYWSGEDITGSNHILICTVLCWYLPGGTEDNYDVRIISVRTTSMQAEIWSWKLPNMKQGYQPSTTMFGSKLTWLITLQRLNLKYKLLNGSYYQLMNNSWECFNSIWGGADKSLARPTSRCRRMESIVLLERGVCSCVKLQVFSCYRGWKEACQVTHAISTWRRELSPSSFFSLQGKVPKEIHAMGTCTIVCHCQKLGGPV